LSKPRLAISLSSASYEVGELNAFLEVARAADAAGIDALRIPEHVALGADFEQYLWGNYPYGVEAPWLEPLTLIAAMAAVTERIRFVTGILIAPMRPAVILAKQAATIDLLSGGRLCLGVGTGWQREELGTAGVPFAERGDRLTEMIEACRVLWRDAPASFHGRWTSFDEVWCEPRPAAGSVPVWFAGSLTSRTIRRVVELGEGWLPIMGSGPAVIAEGVGVLHEAYVAAGRDPATLEVTMFAPPVAGDDGQPSLDRTLEGALVLGDAGVTLVSLFPPSFVPGIAETAAWIEVAARRWESL